MPLMMKKAVLTGVATALLTLGAATTASASSAPTSPFGVTDARLCGQTAFSVDMGEAGSRASPPRALST